MKRPTFIILTLVLAASAGGCFGPQKVTRHLDDWTHQAYADDPWLAGNVLSAVAIRLVSTFTWVIDGLVVNPLDFWGVSAWPFGSGRGTPFHHAPLVPTQK